MMTQQFESHLHLFVSQANIVSILSFFPSQIAKLIVIQLIAYIIYCGQFFESVHLTQSFYFILF